MASQMKILSVECVADLKCQLGEGPLWDPRVGKLIWLDIKGGKLFRFDPCSAHIESFQTSGMLSALGLAKDGGYVCTTRNGFHHLQIGETQIELQKISDPEFDITGNRFNDGKVDPWGGFWAGTMDDAEEEVSGNWWRLSPSGQTSKLASGFKVTNGPAFDEPKTRVFLTDSAAQTIFVAPLEGETIGPLNPFLKFNEADGFPDGLEVDQAGRLWVAFWDGGEIRCFSPTGQILLSVTIGVPRPTSLAFVGDEIYVTSARIGLNQEQLEKYPLSGGLFKVVLDQALSDQQTQKIFAG